MYPLCIEIFSITFLSLQLHVIKLWCPYVLWKYIFYVAIWLRSLCSLIILIWQNSFNLMYDNPEILIIQYLRRVVPSLEVFLFSRKKLHHCNRQISGSCSKRPPKSENIFFYDVMQHWLVVSYPSFGTSYWSHLKGSSSPSRILHGLLDPWRWNW